MELSRAYIVGAVCSLAATLHGCTQLNYRPVKPLDAREYQERNPKKQQEQEEEEQFYREKLRARYVFHKTPDDLFVSEQLSERNRG